MINPQTSAPEKGESNAACVCITCMYVCMYVCIYVYVYVYVYLYVRVCVVPFRSNVYVSTSSLPFSFQFFVFSA